jgi:nucleoside-diphosphate-sugar epimerase
MKIAILGATGKTGGHAMQIALASGHEVRVLARDPAKIRENDPLLTTIKGDATKSEDCARVVEGCAAVVAALGPQGLGATTLRRDSARALVEAMKQNGVKRIVWLSALGVGDSMPQMRRSTFIGSRIFVPLLLKKTYVDVLAAEDVLRASDRDYVLCRPPRLTDKPATGVIEVVPADKKLPRLVTTRADVAAWMVSAAADGGFDRQAVTIC